MNGFSGDRKNKRIRIWLRQVGFTIVPKHRNNVFFNEFGAWADLRTDVRETDDRETGD